MKKLLIILLLFILLGCSQTRVPTILAEEYSFLMTDGKITKLRQTGDTLYEFTCFINQPCYFKPETHYKIIDAHKSADITVLKLERLDSIPLTDDFCPGKRFSIMAIKNIDANQLGYRPPVPCLTLKQLDTIQISTSSLSDKSYLTFFNDTYLKKLSTFKKVSTKDAVKEIIDIIENNNFDSGIISYSAEQLNKACIKKGYNPSGAGLLIDSLMK